MFIEHAINFDENSGRLRLADFLYSEYSLEEVIYQLAKVGFRRHNHDNTLFIGHFVIFELYFQVIFTQSLSKDSEEAQIVLQRLTNFLEAEGANGRISPALQKKVLGNTHISLRNPLQSLRLPIVNFFFRSLFCFQMYCL